MGHHECMWTPARASRPAQNPSSEDILSQWSSVVSMLPSLLPRSTPWHLATSSGQPFENRTNHTFPWSAPTISRQVFHDKTWIQHTRDACVQMANQGSFYSVSQAQASKRTPEQRCWCLSLLLPQREDDSGAAKHHHQQRPQSLSSCVQIWPGPDTSSSAPHSSHAVASQQLATHPHGRVRRGTARRAPGAREK